MKRRQIECFNCGEPGHGKRDCPHMKRSHSVITGQGDKTGQNALDTSVLSSQTETASHFVIHNQPIDLWQADKSQPLSIQPMVLSDFFAGQSCDLQSTDIISEMSSSQNSQWDRSKTDDLQSLQRETKSVVSQLDLARQPVDLSRPPPFGLLMPQGPPQAFLPDFGYNDPKASNSIPLVRSDQQTCPNIGDGMPSYVQNQLRQHCSTPMYPYAVSVGAEVQQVFPRAHSLPPSTTFIPPDCNAMMASQMSHVPLSASPVNSACASSYKTYSCEGGSWQQNVYGPTSSVVMQPQQQILSTPPTMSALPNVPSSVLHDVDISRPPPSFSSVDMRPLGPEPHAMKPTSSESQTGIDAVMWKTGSPAGFSAYGPADIAFHQGRCHLPMAMASADISSAGDYLRELELAMRSTHIDDNQWDDIRLANFISSVAMRDDLISRQNSTPATASVQNFGRKVRSRDPYGLDESPQFSIANEILSATDSCYHDRMFEGQGCISPFNIASLTSSSDSKQVLIPLQRLSCEPTLVTESNPLYHLPESLNQTSVVGYQQSEIDGVQPVDADIDLGFSDQVQEGHAATTSNLQCIADVETSRSSTSLSKDENSANLAIHATGETPASSSVHVLSSGNGANDGQMYHVCAPPSDAKMYMPPSPEREVVTYSFLADVSEVPYEQQLSLVHQSNANVSETPNEKTGDAVSPEMQNMGSFASDSNQQRTETGDDSSNSKSSNEEIQLSKTAAVVTKETGTGIFQNIATDFGLKGYHLTKGMVLYSIILEFP
jgi:hypothetical protein